MLCMHPVQSWVVPLQHASFAFAGYKNAVQSIGYAAAYPAYPLNPPLVIETYDVISLFDVMSD